MKGKAKVLPGAQVNPGAVDEMTIELLKALDAVPKRERWRGDWDFPGVEAVHAAIASGAVAAWVHHGDAPEGRGRDRADVHGLWLYAGGCLRGGMLLGGRGLVQRVRWEDGGGGA